MSPITDSHAHLSMAISRGIALGEVFRHFHERPGSLLIDVGTEPDDLDARLRTVRDAWRPFGLGGEYPPFLRVSAGLYPSKDNLADPEASLSRLEAAIGKIYRSEPSPIKDLSRPPLAAIGECGVDFHRMEADAERQRRLFALQLRLAGKMDVPVIVHSREAHADTLAELAARPPSVKAVIHCFSYGIGEAREYLDAGAYLSFAGNLSYKDSIALREAAAFAPADRILCETDAPYLNPEPRRGRPSSPLDVERTLSLLARLRSVKEEDLALSIAENARRLFG